MSINWVAAIGQREGFHFIGGRTKQSFKREVEINNILKRFASDGLITHVNSRQPQYLDVSSVGDYSEAVARVKAVEEFFAGYPSKIRTRFSNSPAVFLDFMSDPANHAEARELGLMQKLPVDPPAEPPAG